MKTGTVEKERLIFEDWRVRIHGDMTDKGPWVFIDNKLGTTVEIVFPRTDDFCDVSFRDEEAPSITVPPEGESVCAFGIGLNWIQAFERGDFTVWKPAEEIPPARLDGFEEELKAAVGRYGADHVDVIIGSDEIYGMYHSRNDSFAVTGRHGFGQLSMEYLTRLAGLYGVGLGEG